MVAIVWLDRRWHAIGSEVRANPGFHFVKCSDVARVACCVSSDAERTADRSIEMFLEFGLIVE